MVFKLGRMFSTLDSHTETAYTLIPTMTPTLNMYNIKYFMSLLWDTEEQRLGVCTSWFSPSMCSLSKPLVQGYRGLQPLPAHTGHRKHGAHWVCDKFTHSGWKKFPLHVRTPMFVPNQLWHDTTAGSHTSWFSYVSQSIQLVERRVAAYWVTGEKLWETLIINAFGLLLLCSELWLLTSE